ncbi:hypothetical protein F4813DRAFT_399495 [Daldinia decipiens]|uniref:uncharacterized protein n=1 Tax=Daldinia decipiens TaxID=326647 RepID=UPI0020C507B9|nr:uncharacterized protein F4813DRAFT_399495 [Daldinia decipiens]KAI1653938.1 hypothetical protein F4813DRAFT_399495 [Daldinia decipiens]
MSSTAEVRLEPLGLALLRQASRIESWVRGLDVEHTKLSDYDRKELQRWIDWIYEDGGVVRLAALQVPDNTTLREGQSTLDNLENLIRAVLGRDDYLNVQGRN